MYSCQGFRHPKHFNDFRLAYGHFLDEFAHHFSIFDPKRSSTGQPLIRMTVAIFHSVDKQSAQISWLTCAHHIDSILENNTHFWVGRICDFTHRRPFDDDQFASVAFRTLRKLIVHFLLCFSRCSKLFVCSGHFCAPKSTKFKVSLLINYCLRETLSSIFNFVR